MDRVRWKRVLVFGGRDFTNTAFVCRKLTELDATHGPFDVIIHGGAHGVDSAADLWAQANIRLTKPFQVSGSEWQERGGAAGPMRNQRMLDEGKPDGAIAFPGRDGTADMLRRCLSQGVRVIEVRTA